jgi:hypothetical protein
LVTEDAELEGEVRALGFDGGVDAVGVELEEVELVGRVVGEGAVCGGADLEGALDAVMLKEGGTEDFGEVAGDVAAEGVHLPEAVLRGDVALGDDEVVEGCGVDVGDAVCVALDGDGRGESGDGESAVELRERVAKGLADPVAADEEAGDGEDDDDGDEDEGDFGDETTKATMRGQWPVVDGAMGKGCGLGGFGCFVFVVAHVLGEV